MQEDHLYFLLFGSVDDVFTDSLLSNLNKSMLDIFQPELVVALTLTLTEQIKIFLKSLKPKRISCEVPNEPSGPT